jgi:hypothetical protein
MSRSHFFLLAANGLHIACGGFEALSCPPKSKMATERKPCLQPFTRHKLYAVCVPCMSCSAHLLYALEKD